MDLTNLSQAEKAMLAFCGIFVIIFSTVMYYSMIVLPRQDAPSQESATRSAHIEPRGQELQGKGLVTGAGEAAPEELPSTR